MSYQIQGPTSIVLSLTAEQIAAVQYAGALPDWARLDGVGLHLTGGLCGYRQTFVYVGDDEIWCSRSIDDLVHHVADRGRLAVASAGVSHTLQSGFVPLPSTVYSDMYRLCAGDEMVANAADGKIQVRISDDYPWVASESQEDQIPDPDRLFELICASVESQVKEAGGEAILAMSSGKDSVSLALAVAELGYDVPCFTYRPDDRDVEHVFAAQFAKTLGLRHFVVEAPVDRESVRRTMTHYFENAAAPSVDHALIPLMTLVAESGLTNGGVIDGGGNDGYMGYVSSRTRELKSRLRIRPRSLAKVVGRLTRVDSKVNYLARSDVASSLPGRNLRHHETKRLYGPAVEAAGFWYELSDTVRRRSRMDALALSLIRQTEGARSNDKVRFIAPAFGLEPLLPFCDLDLADYYFNLPQEARYEPKTGVNKVLLRELLEQKIRYSESGVGDGYFGFDGAAFVMAHEEFVREEIFSCDLWEPGAREIVDGWLKAMAHRPFLFHVVVPMFLLSGWHNHSRYLNT